MTTKARITIVGLGRIGASLGLAIKKGNPDLEIIGHDKDQRAGQAAQKAGAVDRTEWNLLNSTDGAGLVILAMPAVGVKQALDVLKPELASGVIVTDTSSTKVAVMKWAEGLPAGVSFVGGHPIIPPSAEPKLDAAGAELPDADLFRNAVYCLVPAMNASEQAVQVTSSMVSLIGAKPLFLDAQEHDGLITGAEHLPYLLAVALLRSTTTSSGWRDMSRVAGREYLQATASAARDAKAQRELMLNHREDLVRWIDIVEGTLEEMRKALQSGDTERLDTMIDEMIEARTAWLKGPGGGTPMMNTDEFKPSLTRMLLGGLGGRERKKK